MTGTAAGGPARARARERTFCGGGLEPADKDLMHEPRLGVHILLIATRLQRRQAIIVLRRAPR